MHTRANCGAHVPTLRTIPQKLLTGVKTDLEIDLFRSKRDLLTLTWSTLC